MSCSGDSPHDLDKLFLDHIMYRFVSDTKLVRSVDGFLVKLNSLVFEIEDFAKTFGHNPEELFRKVLTYPEVIEVLKPLAGYALDVERIIASDPRHKSLRPYLNVLTTFLRELPPSTKYLIPIRQSHNELEAANVKSEPEQYIPVYISEHTGGKGKERKDGKTKKRVIAVTAFVICLLITLEIVLDPQPISTTLARLYESLNTIYHKISSPTQTVSTSTTTKITSTPTTNLTVDNVKRAALNELNAIRRRYDLPSLQLLDLGIAQFRADDMVYNNYFGHCDLRGMIPNYWYTRLGGQHYVEENVGLTTLCRGYVSATNPADISVQDALNYSIDHVNNMVYNDAASNWGHRDSLLDPTNNYVDIGVTWKKGMLILTIHMLKVWVNWTVPPTYNENTGTFKACGYLTLNNSQIESVVIYRYEPKPEVGTVGNSCVVVKDTCRSYSLGTPVAGVVPPNSNMFYLGIKTIKATRWEIKGNMFCIEFNWIPSTNDLHSIVIYAKNTIGVKHPFDIDRYKDVIPVLSYSIIKSQS